MLLAENDADLKNKLIYAKNTFENKFAIVFGSGSRQQDIETFEYVRQIANEVKSYADFLIVDIDLCKESKNKYNITATPAFVFQKTKAVRYPSTQKDLPRIVGDDYQIEFYDFIVSKHNTDLMSVSIFLQT